MIDLEEAKQRLLSELEEAGEENVPTLLNTIFAPSGNEDEVEVVVDALAALVREGFALVAVANTDKTSWKTLDPAGSLSELMRISEFIQFVPESSNWDDARDVGPPYSLFNVPLVVATDEGQRKAFEILDERGYQWWRQTER